MTGYFYGIITSINGVLSVLITGISGHNCNPQLFCILPTAWTNSSAQQRQFRHGQARQPGRSACHQCGATLPFVVAIVAPEAPKSVLAGEHLAAFSAAVAM